MMPDLVRADGLGWAFGRAAGAYGQMHCISLILQGLRDGWIPDEQKVKYYDILRRLFMFFYETYLDQEHGFLDLRDEERTAYSHHTTRMANFDAARYLCQWSRLAKTVQMPPGAPKIEPPRTSGRFVIFDKSNRKEQGLFLYRDAETGLHLQVPLISSGTTLTSDSLAFPHCPGIFDWPNNVYLPIMLPELTFGENATLPAFYGKNCVTGLGLRNSFYFRYEQPELINLKEEIVKGIGSVKVQWTFAGNKIGCEFAYTVKQQVTLDKFRYCLAIAAPIRSIMSVAPSPSARKASAAAWPKTISGGVAGDRGGQRRSDLPNELRQGALPAISRSRSPAHHAPRARLPFRGELRARCDAPGRVIRSSE